MPNHFTYPVPPSFSDRGTPLIKTLSSFLLIAFHCSSVLGATPKTNDELLDRKIPEFIFKSGDQFHHLCEELAIPCGEEMLPSESTFQAKDEDYGLREENVSVRTLLDKMAMHHPGYLWEIADGVLVFRPHAPGIVSPLESHIRSFEQKGLPLGDTLGMLARAERIKPGSLAHGLTGHFPPEFVDSQSRTIDISVRDATVRQALNLAVATHGRGIWIYTYNTPARQFAELILPESFVPNSLQGGTLDCYAY